ncbi:MAG: hypothetical protein H0V70_13240 [Ktedonobacteraceae bacterium]|nr:hypothetical protein [Ktedonobacteraceae bacterium]
MSDRNVGAIAGKTPVRVIVAGITPIATRIPRVICVHTPTVVVQPTATPQKVEVYAVNNNPVPQTSKARRVRSKVVHVRKNKPHSRKRPHVKAVATSAPQKTVPVITPPSPSPSPSPATPQPIVLPDIIATVTVTPVPTQETTINSMPDIVVINVTPDRTTSSPDSFSSGLRHRGVMRIPVPPETKRTQKSTTKKSVDASNSIECSGSTTSKNGSAGKVLNKKRRIGVLLGGALSGIVLFCTSLCVRKRKEYTHFLRRFKISSKNS